VKEESETNAETAFAEGLDVNSQLTKVPKQGGAPLCS